MSNASRSASAEPTEATDSTQASTSTSILTQPSKPAGSATVDDKTKDAIGHPDSSQEGQDNGDTDKNNTSANDQEEIHGSVDRSVSDTPSSSATPSQGDWQAIWSPMHNAYYFYNSQTNETTWTNPLQPPPLSEQVTTTGPETSTSTSTAPYSSSTLTTNPTYAAQAAAEAAGIDPSLAFLDPSLGLPGSTPAGTFAAKFNARTGAFTRADARDPSHLSETERAKRMSEVYFDVGAWEQELEKRTAEEEANGKKRKRPSKKDLEKFKEQKRLKKIAKTAWLRT